LISSWIIVASSFTFILIFNPFRDSSGSFILENNNNKSSIVGNLKLYRETTILKRGQNKEFERWAWLWWESFGRILSRLTTIYSPPPLLLLFFFSGERRNNDSSWA
jgi:hypothetical protein